MCLVVITLFYVENDGPHRVIHGVVVAAHGVAVQRRARGHHPIRLPPEAAGECQSIGGRPSVEVLDRAAGALFEVSPLSPSGMFLLARFQDPR
jgi:hypothetical protein